MLILRIPSLYLLLSCEQDHVEGYLELSAKTKTYFATAVTLWDADFYVKVDDDVHVNIGKNLFPVIDTKISCRWTFSSEPCKFKSDDSYE